jgi:hypothetical protein
MSKAKAKAMVAQELWELMRASQLVHLWGSLGSQTQFEADFRFVATETALWNAHYAVSISIGISILNGSPHYKCLPFLLSIDIFVSGFLTDRSFPSWDSHF